MINRMSEHERVLPRRTGRGGRPSKGPRTYVGLRVPDPLHEAIEAARAASGLTLNDFVIGLAEAALTAGLLPSGEAQGQDRLPLSA
jgi:predicted HicB family RNase H-like nuclease